MNTMPNITITYALLEFIIESCLLFCSDPIIAASESFVPENKKENPSERKIILIMIK